VAPNGVPRHPVAWRLNAARIQHLGNLLDQRHYFGENDATVGTEHSEYSIIKFFDNEVLKSELL
jgi:hypothetical protein